MSGEYFVVVVVVVVVVLSDFYREQRPDGVHRFNVISLCH